MNSKHKKLGHFLTLMQSWPQKFSYNSGNAMVMMTIISPRKTRRRNLKSLSFLRLRSRSFLISILAGTTLLISCKPEKNDPLDDLLFNAALIYLLTRPVQAPLFASQCAEYSGHPNSLYNNDDYYPRFRDDPVQYKNLILGDSTMDLTRFYDGFIDPSQTQNLAVGGNSLCDMERQMIAINTTEPENILISTAGGIDLLRELEEPLIENSLELLLDRIHVKFPAASIHVVAVHPTQISAVNVRRGDHNEAMKAIVESHESETAQSSCYFDPRELFTDDEGDPVGSTDPAPDEHMIQLPDGSIDRVHYNQAMSFSIKSELEKSGPDGCDLSF